MFGYEVILEVDRYNKSFSMLNPKMYLVDIYKKVLINTLCYKTTFSLVLRTRLIGFFLSVDVIA